MKKCMKSLGEFLVSGWGMPILAICFIMFSPIIFLGLLVWGQVEWYFMTPEEVEAAREAAWDDGYTP